MTKIKAFIKRFPCLIGLHGGYSYTITIWSTDSAEKMKCLKCGKEWVNEIFEGW